MDTVKEEYIMKHKKLKRGLKYKFKKIIRKLKRIFALFMIAFVIYNVVSYINTEVFGTKTAQDNEIVVESQKPVKTAKNDKIEGSDINVNVVDIPVCSNSQTKTYMDYKMITDKTSKQWQYIHTSGKIKIENGYLMEGEYIGVALGSYFGEIGTKYIFTLDTGKQIKVVKIEEKADAHTNNGCQQKWDKSVIEFVIDSNAFEKSSNGYVYNGNFNNIAQFKGKIIKIEEIVKKNE
jgi:hypothetical protein